VTWLIHMCDMAHSYVWHGSFICVTWLIHMCDMTHSYVTRTTQWVRLAWMSHVTHMNESCHTYEWVMSHILSRTHWYEDPNDSREWVMGSSIPMWNIGSIPMWNIGMDEWRPRWLAWMSHCAHGHTGSYLAIHSYVKSISMWNIGDPNDSFTHRRPQWLIHASPFLCFT